MPDVQGAGAGFHHIYQISRATACPARGTARAAHGAIVTHRHTFIEGMQKCAHASSPVKIPLAGSDAVQTHAPRNPQYVPTLLTIAFAYVQETPTPNHFLHPSGRWWK
jgi:hypothetical protein